MDLQLTLVNIFNHRLIGVNTVRQEKRVLAIAGLNSSLQEDKNNMHPSHTGCRTSY